ncbi:MAG: SigB/SigF/SigG family RNA polymerase sigma factor [Lachnospiraceae bacterium]|nr:SigB/SigF/SigG family RNA polymerase sigma factor [Lachnospiraceae bacterium]
MDQTREWIRRAKEGNQEAKEKLILENTGLVWNVVKGFHGRGYDKEELFQIGCIGLIKSIERFDLSYGVKFSTYAVPLITGEIRRFFRDDGMIKVSRKWKEDGYKIYQTIQQLTQKLGREPDLNEISDYCGISVENIIFAMDANAEVESLNRTFQTDGKEVAVMDRIPSDENMEEKILEHMALKQAMNELTEKEQKLIQMRYFQNKTQMEVSREFGVSQVQVSRMEKKILLKLRSSFM